MSDTITNCQHIHAKGHDVEISTHWLDEKEPFAENNVRLLDIKAGSQTITIFLNRDDKITFTTSKGD